MRPFALLLAFTLGANVVARTPSLTIFTTLGLTADQIAAVEAGQPVAKVLDWGGPSEVYVFGAVHIDGTPETYLKAALDIRRLSSASGHLGGGRIPDQVTEANLKDLTFEVDDVNALKTCREGACDVQLPTASMEEFRAAIDFSRPGAVEQANALGRAMVLRMVRSYQKGGDEALGAYRDKEQPAQIADEFRTMIGRTSVLPDVIPELRRYLLEYPNATLPDAQSFFYWEKVAFGLKPTIRVNHAVVYRRRAEGHDFAVLAIKQLYATHYFHTALDVSVCVADADDASGQGFYLLTLKGSQQEGLTGVKGSMLRRAVVERTRRALERGLAAIKQTVEKRR